MVSESTANAGNGAAWNLMRKMKKNRCTSLKLAVFAMTGIALRALGLNKNMTLVLFVGHTRAYVKKVKRYYHLYNLVYM